MTDSESPLSLDGAKAGQEDPAHHAGKADGLAESLPIPQKLYAHHIVGVAGEQLIE